MISFHVRPSIKVVSILISVCFVSALSLIKHDPYVAAENDAINVVHGANNSVTNPLTWTVEIVDQTNSAYKLTSLDVDSSSHPRIAYLDTYVVSGTNYGNLIYSWNDGLGWVTQGLTSTGAYDYPDSGISLALDDSDKPHISYHYFDPLYWPYVGGNLNHIWQNGQDWQDTIVDSGQQKFPVGVFPSTVVDSIGHVHIGYARHDYLSLENSNCTVGYAYYTSTNWVTETVANTAGPAWNVSLAVDLNGNPYMSYFDYSLRELQLAWRAGKSWYTETITNISPSGLTDSAFWLDENNHPYVALATNSFSGSPQVTYGWRDDYAWKFETLNLGEIRELALTVRLGVPYIGYSTSGPSILKFAYKDSGGWHSEVVDVSGGEGLSLAIDGLMRPHFSYLGSDQKTLRYAHRPCPLDRCGAYALYLPLAQQ